MYSQAVLHCCASLFQTQSVKELHPWLVVVRYKQRTSQLPVVELIWHIVCEVQVL